mgnify:CR=1 FL=1
MNKPLPEDPMMRDLIKMARRHQMTRRTALAGASATAAALALAACSPGGSAGKKTLTPAKDMSASDPNLIWSNWSLYIDLDDKGAHPTLDRFKKEQGITVEYREDYDDNDTYYAKVKDQLALGQDIGADLVCPTQWMAARWINLGYTQTFDDAVLVNKKNVQPAYLGAAYDPKREQSLPYQGILGGIAYNKKAYKEATGKVAPATIDDLWNPALKGRVGVLSEMRDTVGLILMSQGIDITSDKSLTSAAFDNAIGFLQKQVDSGQIAKIKGNSYKEDLVNGDTIAAIATAPGRGAVGIVRVSGRGLAGLVRALCGRALPAREATYLPFRDADGSPIDRGLALHFPAPHSFTGEDVLELQAHGGPVVLQLLVQRCLQAAASVDAASGQPVLAGLRLAQPGEFAERAFLNDKIDLAQAEAIADLIDASTEAAARSASRSLAGDFSREIGQLREALIHLRMLVEATLDFPEEGHQAGGAGLMGAGRTELAMSVFGHSYGTGISGTASANEPCISEVKVMVLPTYRSSKICRLNNRPKTRTTQRGVLWCLTSTNQAEIPVATAIATSTTMPVNRTSNATSGMRNRSPSTAP